MVWVIDPPAASAAVTLISGLVPRAEAGLGQVAVQSPAEPVTLTRAARWYPGQAAEA